MSLFDRIVGKQEPKIPVHQFQGAMTEWVASEQEPGWEYVSRQDVIDTFDIQADEEAYLDQLFAWYMNASDVLKFAVVFDNVFMLAEEGMLGYEDQLKTDDRLAAQSNQ